MQNDKITLSRRITGGGAVYHDLGNTCFSFLTPYKAQDQFDYKTVNNIILTNALKQLGVNAEVSGRNDITYNKKKISGSAYKLNLGNLKTGQGKKALHHGTVLFNVQTEALKRYLNPNKAKLQSKGVNSVISRVTNLNEQFPHLNHKIFSQVLEKKFIEYYQPKEVESKILNYKQFQQNPYIQKRFKELKSWQWLYGTTPQFNNNIQTRFQWGIIDIYFDVEEGVIKKAKVFSDSIWIDYISYLDEILNSKKIKYDFLGISQISNLLTARFNEAQFIKYTQQLCEWIRTKI